MEIIATALRSRSEEGIRAAASKCEEWQLAPGEEGSLTERWSDASKREVWNQAVITCAEAIEKLSPSTTKESGD
jgi:hypothetical protein